MSAPAIDAKLTKQLIQIAQLPILLVGCDYDGTIADIVSDPSAATPNQSAVQALRALANLDSTTVAIISGRALKDLAILSRLPAEIRLIGSHGAEFDTGFIHKIDKSAQKLHTKLLNLLNKAISKFPKASLEIKPTSVAIHYRKLDHKSANLLLEQIKNQITKLSNIYTIEGKKVIELSVIPTNKGNALEIMRQQITASATIFIGDDITDESGFKKLHEPDIGIKVGTGKTKAKFRVTDVNMVAKVLNFLYETRRKWLLGSDAIPIDKLSLLASANNIALISPEASINWLCSPTPDSAAIFAELLGGEEAGNFVISPKTPTIPLTQKYIDSTMTIQTNWSGLQVVDYLTHDAPYGNNNLIRIISGNIPAKIRFAPRPEFGQIPVKIEKIPNGVKVVDTNYPIVLLNPGNEINWEIVTEGKHHSAYATVNPSGKDIILELHCGINKITNNNIPEIIRRETTQKYWSDWVNNLNIPNYKQNLLKRSLLVLKGLVSEKYGSIMAAATTSLPETIGGIRNWDYRFCWLRDAGLVCDILLAYGSLTETNNFLNWLQNILAKLSGPEKLQPLYTLAGEKLSSPETTLDTLSGYAGSRPVRIGNAANYQVQLDVFGIIVTLIKNYWELKAQNGIENPVNQKEWDLVTAMVNAVEKRWQEPDHGIWEIRTKPRQHVYSKVMCWTAVANAITIGEKFNIIFPAKWYNLKEKIRTTVITKGWNEKVKSYTAAFKSTDLDAASLHIGLSGLISPTDENFISTVLEIESTLRSGATVYRYKHEDGLPGIEGGFHLCTTWLIEAYLKIGQHTAAVELFEQLCKLTGPTGLLSEEYDPIAEIALGNHPQAYSHIGLLKSGLLIANNCNV